jgi:hypothetical protein
MNSQAHGKRSSYAKTFFFAELQVTKESFLSHSKFVILKRSFIARGIYFAPGQQRFLTGEERGGITKCKAVQTDVLPRSYFSLRDSAVSL